MLIGWDVSRSMLEAIPLTARCQYMLGGLGLLLQFLPQPGDMDIHRALGDERLFAPNLMENLLAGQHLAPMVDEQPQQFRFLGGKADRQAAFGEHHSIESRPSRYRIGSGAPESIVPCEHDATARPPGPAVRPDRTV